MHKIWIREPSRLIAPLLILLGLSGCGADPGETVRERALSLQTPLQEAYERVDMQAHPSFVADLQLQVAHGLDGLLEQYPETDENLRRVLDDLSRENLALGRGEISGDEAEQVRQRHEEYWAHIEAGDVPPEYR